MARLSLPGRAVPVAGIRSQPGVAQLLSQCGQSPMAFPQLGNEIGPRRFLPQLPVDVSHPDQVRARPLVIVPTAGLDQALHLLPVDVDGGARMGLRSNLGHADQLVCLVGKTDLSLLHRFQSQVDFTLFQVDVGQQTVLPSSRPLGQQVRTQFLPDTQLPGQLRTS